MQEFLLLIHGSEYKDQSPKMMKTHMKRYAKWMEELYANGKFIKGHRLDNSGAYLVDKETIITDGPFLESKEIIGGYILIKANDLGDAAKVAQSCPLSDEFSISIRPMFNGNNEHEFPKR